MGYFCLTGLSALDIKPRMFSKSFIFGCCRREFPLLALILFAFAIRIALINRPFLPNDEGTSTGIPVIHAMNIARYGLLDSRFAGVLNFGQVDSSNWAIYVHHPPLVPVLIALVYYFFGVSEWSTRLMPAMFSLGVTFLLYMMTSHRFGVRIGFLAGIFYALSPITIVFGGMPDYVNAQVVFFMLATTESYLRWRETKMRLWLALMIISFILGSLSDWPVFYLVPVLGGHYWLRGGHSVSRTLALTVPAFVVLITLFLWAYWASGDTWTNQFGSPLHQFIHRTFRLGPITFEKWVKTVLINHLAWLHTWPVFLLTGSYIGFIVSWILRRNWETLAKHEAPILLLFVAAFHLSVGIQGNYHHAWWAVIVTAPLAFAAALALDTLVRYFANRSHVETSILIVVLLLFFSFSVPAAYLKVNQQWLVLPGKDIGYLIQKISRPNEGVVTTASNKDPTLWYYADRQLRPEIVDLSQLKDSLAPGPYPLPYWYPQEYGPPPRWFVVPPPDRKIFKQLIDVLDRRFPRRDINGYAVYQLY